MAPKTPNLPTFKLTYGTLALTGRMRSNSQRIEVYTRDEDGEQFVETCFVTGPDDLSPRHDGEYNPMCSCCWLGFTHSENKHKEGIL